MNKITKENYKDYIGDVVRSERMHYELVGYTSGLSFVGLDYSGTLCRLPDDLTLCDVDDLIGKTVMLEGWSDMELFEIDSRRGLYYYGINEEELRMSSGVWHNWRKI